MAPSRALPKHEDATSRVEARLLLCRKEMYEDVGVLRSRVSHRVGRTGITMRTLARSEVLELSAQVVIPLSGKPGHVSLT